MNKKFQSTYHNNYIAFSLLCFVAVILKANTRYIRLWPHRYSNIYSSFRIDGGRKSLDILFNNE